MTNKKPRKYSEMVGEMVVQTKKQNMADFAERTNSV